jgi:hypothetical protein
MIDSRPASRGADPRPVKAFGGVNKQCRERVGCISVISKGSAKLKDIEMKKLASIALGATGLFLMILPTTGQAENCRGLRWACEHKEELGLQGAGTCRRYRETCLDGGGFDSHGGGFGGSAVFGGGGDLRLCAHLRWTCEHKEELGLQGAGTCKRYRETCG